MTHCILHVLVLDMRCSAAHSRPLLERHPTAECLGCNIFEGSLIELLYGLSKCFIFHSFFSIGCLSPGQDSHKGLSVSQTGFPPHPGFLPHPGQAQDLPNRRQVKPGSPKVSKRREVEGRSERPAMERPAA